MDMVVYKYLLKDGITVQDIEMPRGAEILHAGNQFEHICLWAVVDPSEKNEKRRIGVIATGQHFDDAGAEYLGTVHLQGDSLIFHVFEQTMFQTGKP